MAECNLTEELAEASERLAMDIKQFRCGICMENYINPRYLPTCGHTFCERCLLRYAHNLQQQGSKLECPVCKKPQDLPENELKLDWIQIQCPLNTAVIKMMGSTHQTKTEQEEVRRDCDPCKERGEAVVGVKFCMDCQEVYCKDCTESHKSFKMSRNHRLMDTKELSAVSDGSSFFESFTKCPDHPGREADFYCMGHEVVICAVCLSSGGHKLCDTVEVTDDNRYNTTAAEFRENSDELTTQMRATLGHLNNLLELLEENKTNLKQKLNKIRHTIEEMRDQVVALMDNVVSHVSNATKQIEIENEDKIDADISRVLQLKSLIEEKLTLCDTVDKHGSQRHKFISTYLMKTQFREINGKISAEDRHLKTIDAELKVADDIRKLIERNDAGKLAQVDVNETESMHTHLRSGKHFLKGAHLVRTDEHTVRPRTDCIPYFSGVSIHRDGRIVLCDNGGYLCLYNPSNRTMLNLQLNGPWNAAAIDGTHIAVSIPIKKEICIVTVGDELRVEKRLKTQCTPKSLVALRNGQLALTWTDPPAIGVVDISGGEIEQKIHIRQDIYGQQFKPFGYLAVDEKRHHLVVSSSDNSLYCFDFRGELIFKYTDTLLNDPRGVALDKCGNIYVCACNNAGIHKFSPSGELICIMKQGIPSYPRAACSNRSGTGVWVTQTAVSSLDKLLYFSLEQKN